MRNWLRFMRCWRSSVNERIKVSGSFHGLTELPAEVNVLPATPPKAEETSSRLSALVQKLGIDFLPDSYVEYCMAFGASPWFVEAIGEYRNGKLLCGKIFAFDSVQWFSSYDPKSFSEWMESAVAARDLERFVDSDPVVFGRNELESALVIGDAVEGGYLLLNTGKRETLDGLLEFEAWYLDSKIPGALRFRSFAILMASLARGDIRNEGPWNEDILDGTSIVDHSCSRILLVDGAD